MGTIFPPKPNTLEEIFDKKKPIIGVLHLKPLPGSPYFKGESLEKAIDFAIKDAISYENGGVDGLIVENGWDMPFLKPEDVGPETVAGLTAVTQEVKKEVELPLGINCLANAAIQSLAIAKATDCQWVRVNQWINAYIANEGFIEGAASKAMRYRSKIKADEIKIFADIHVKHGSHSIIADRSVEEQTRDAVWFDADVLIGSGNRTGDPTPLNEIKKIKISTELPVIVGSGLNKEIAYETLKLADGAIVASSLKEDGLWWKPVDENRVKELMEEVYKLR